MSRNLCSSKCQKCGHLVTLNDLRGKPLEARQYEENFAPYLGVRFDCTCGEVYFASITRDHSYWGEEQLQSGDWKKATLQLPNGQEVPNRQQGRFAMEMENPRTGTTKAINTGYYSIDLSYYASYNDERMWDEKQRQRILDGLEPPRHLCTDAQEKHQWVL